jgi:hypothetical protein
VEAVVEDHQQQVDRVSADFHFVGDGHMGGVRGEDFVFKGIDNRIGGPGIFIDPEFYFAFGTLDTEHIGKKLIRPRTAAKSFFLNGKQPADRCVIRDAEELKNLASQGTVFGNAYFTSLDIFHPRSGGTVEMNSKPAAVVKI